MYYSRKKKLSQARVCKCSHSCLREDTIISGRKEGCWSITGSGPMVLNKILRGMDNGESCRYYPKKLK